MRRTLWKQKTTYYCTQCGNETGKWAGRCSICGSWNTIVEAPAATRAKGPASLGPGRPGTAAPRPVTELEEEEELRFSTGLAEMDRVLGGGRGTRISGAGGRRPGDWKIHAAFADLRAYAGGKGSLCHRGGKPAGN